MKRLIGVLLVTTMVAAGCAKSGSPTTDRPASDAGQRSANNVSPAPPEPKSPKEPVNEPSNGAAKDAAKEPVKQPAAAPGDDGQVPCRPGTPPTKDEMTDLLARLSTYAPVPHLTGPALEIEQQWLAMQATGWPSDSQTWARDAWFALDITKGASQGYVVRLEHGVYTTDEDRFLVVCNGDRWQVQEHAAGNGHDWLTPAREVPGQRGDLTPALIAALFKAARQARGPWFAQVATGNALAWERVNELYSARGQKLLPNPWQFAAEGAAVTRIDDTHAQARFSGKGDFVVRFEKVDGLWKIQDYTEGGTWVGTPPASRLEINSPVFDPPFGVLVGKTDIKEVEHLFGSPDAVKPTVAGKVYLYDRRKIEVEFDGQGKVSSFSMRTGAPNSGVKVGSPVALWNLVYGPSASVDVGGQRLAYTAQDGKVTGITVTAAKKQ